jgi:hypothetical protein
MTHTFDTGCMLYVFGVSAFRSFRNRSFILTTSETAVKKYIIQ